MARKLDQKVAVVTAGGSRLRVRCTFCLKNAVREPDFEVESWSAKRDLETLREAYAGFHPHVRAVITACPVCLNSSLTIAWD